MDMTFRGIQFKNPIGITVATDSNFEVLVCDKKENIRVFTKATNVVTNAEEIKIFCVDGAAFILNTEDIEAVVIDSKNGNGK